MYKNYRGRKTIIYTYYVICIMEYFKEYNTVHKYYSIYGKRQDPYSYTFKWEGSICKYSTSRSNRFERVKRKIYKHLINEFLQYIIGNNMITYRIYNNGDYITHKYTKYSDENDYIENIIIPKYDYAYYQKSMSIICISIELYR